MSNRPKLGQGFRTAPRPKASADRTKNAFWNGLPTYAVRGTAVVADAPEFPQYWAKTEGIIGERIPVVQIDLNGVNYGGGIDYLDNRDGSGWHKVTVGHGGPGYGHRNVAIEFGSFQPEGVTQ